MCACARARMSGWYERMGKDPVCVSLDALLIHVCSFTRKCRDPRDEVNSEHKTHAQMITPTLPEGYVGSEGSDPTSPERCDNEPKLPYAAAYHKLPR